MGHCCVIIKIIVMYLKVFALFGTEKDQELQKPYLDF